MKTGTGKLLGWLLLAAIFSFNAVAATFYVNVSNTVSVSPFTDWSTAATNIQDAIDVSSDGDMILVTNGVYATGGRVVYGSLTNRVAINKAITVQSVNGPGVTLIQGKQPNGNNAVRCVYITNNAVLVGFTLTNGATRTLGDSVREQSGGGVWCESTNSMVLNCVVVSNLAYSYFISGGAAAHSGTLNECVLKNNSTLYYAFAAISNVLNNCIIVSNAAPKAAVGACTLNNCTLSDNSGGGAFGCILNNCTVVGNRGNGGADTCVLTNCLVAGNYSSEFGGGAYVSTLVNCTVVSNAAGHAISSGTYFCTLKNCIVYNNFSGGDATGGTLTNCCIKTLPASGMGNFTNAPLFVNLTNDFHLQSNSPCINAGNNAYVPNPTDLDGNPRIVGGTVDIGAYEFQLPASTLSYAWAQQYGLPTDGTADGSDTDGDGMNNWQEWKASTVPTNAASVLQLAAPSNSLSGMIVKWQSVGGVNYYLQRGTNLAAQPAFTSLQSNIVGQAGTTTYTDTTATNATPYFYRVGVQ